MKKINDSAKKKKSHNALYVFSLSVLLLIAITMGTLIYAKSNPSGQIFGISFATINAKLENLTNIFKPNISDKNDQTVSTSPKYQKLGNNYYCYENDSVPALFDGIISNVSTQDDDYFVLVNYTNGVTAYYYELKEVLVKSNDTIKVNDIIGQYETKFKVIFTKNNNTIDYDQAIS